MGDMSSVVLVDDGVLVVGVVSVAHLVQQGAHCQQAELNRHCRVTAAHLRYLHTTSGSFHNSRCSRISLLTSYENKLL